MPTSRHRAQLARDGIFNVRDLGGLPTRSGRVVARGRVLRADSLHRAKASAEALREHGVVRVLDLRDEQERRDDGTLVAEGLEVQHHPVLDPMFSWDDEAAGELDGRLGLRYQEILRAFGPRFATALTAVAEVVGAGGSGGAVAYHCAVGKDRTGLLTALLLGGLDVDDDVIVADYARSAAATAVQVSWLWSLGHPEGSVAEDEIFLGLWSARPETMQRTLDWLAAEFGGAGGYLEQSGVPDGIVEALRVGLLVDPGDQEELHAVRR